jgi:hypothetical protein
MPTLTHQAVTAARTPAKPIFKSWSPMALPINRQDQTLPSVIGWLLFKLCWKTGKGEVRLQVAANCKRTIECLELQSYTEKGDPDKDAGYDHMNDGLGYLVWREFNPLYARAGRIRYGHVGVLVDAPQDGGRPYWIAYSPRDILGWRTELEDGAQKLTQLRLREVITEPDGDYGEKAVEQVRVLTPGAYELHRKDDDTGDFKLYDEGTTTLDRIPFSVAYSDRIGYMESRPPLQDIAELNLKTYQVQSDLDNQLHISAVPMLAFYGFPSSAEEVSAGPGEAIAFPAEGRAEYIEPDGKSFDYQFRRLDQLASQINELGLAAVLGQKLSAETAEAKRIDRSQGDSTMMVIAQNVQDMIDNCLQFHANEHTCRVVSQCHRSQSI